MSFNVFLWVSITVLHSLLSFQIIIIELGGFAFSTKGLSLDQWLWCLFLGIGALLWGQVRYIPLFYMINDCLFSSFFQYILVIRWILWLHIVLSLSFFLPLTHTQHILWICWIWKKPCWSFVGKEFSVYFILRGRKGSALCRILHHKEMKQLRWRIIWEKRESWAITYQSLVLKMIMAFNQQF